MKNIFFIIMILGFSISAAQAQKPKQGGVLNEKIKALQVAVFTEELNLTAKEAQKFWPLYNEYEKKILALNKKLRASGKKDFDSMSDKEVEKLIESRFSLQEQKLKIEKEYYKKFKKVLSVKKVAKIPLAERKFKMTIMRHSKDRRQHKREGKPGNF